MTLTSLFVLPVPFIKDPDVREFLEEATALDPRFKSKLERTEEDTWERIRAAAVAAAATDQVFEFDTFTIAHNLL